MNIDEFINKGAFNAVEFRYFDPHEDNESADKDKDEKDYGSKMAEQLANDGAEVFK